MSRQTLSIYEPSKSVAKSERTDTAELKLILATTDQQDEHYLFDMIKSAAANNVELFNIHSSDALFTALNNYHYDLLICDSRLINQQIFEKLKRLQQSPTTGKLMTFSQDSESSNSELNILYHFIIQNNKMDNLKRLIYTIMQYAWLHSQQTLTERYGVNIPDEHDNLSDKLTNLPNRELFSQLLDETLRNNHQQNFAILLLDLDRFKFINDSLGHNYGDELLVMVTQLLQKCIRPGDYLGRLGGDEFAILLHDIESEKTAIEVAQRINRSLAHPLNIDAQDCFISASIGIVFSKHYRNAEAGDMIRDADIAMYYAKQSGKGKYSLFNNHMHNDMLAVLSLETDLRQAINNDMLQVYYQPIYDLAENHISGFEALVRWHHPHKGIILPNTFIPLAEEMHIIQQIDYMVLEQSAKQLKAWRDHYTHARHLRININLSGVHFDNMTILTKLSHALKSNGLTHDCLQLELTEGVLMNDHYRSLEILGMLSQLGMNINIDDFGMGYSSLSRLARLPVNKLKIDRGFVTSILSDRNSMGIVRAIIDLAHGLEMKVIAEGVETHRQFELLSNLGCDYVQGHLIAKALPAEEAERFLTQELQFKHLALSE